MARTLHVTHGDITGEQLARLFPNDELVLWRDVLHEGPIPTGVTDAELREIRAAFLAAQGWGKESEILEQFAARDAALARYSEFDEVVLWFEHDLYDQLQLIQILDRLPGKSDGETPISLICINTFPGVEPFHGLGQLNDDQLASLYPNRKPVTDEQLIVAREAWAAVRSPEPSAIQRLLDRGTDALPFLAEALVRYLEQFPAVDTGLSRTEQQVLDALRDGPKTPAELFSRSQSMEEHPYLGDLTFFGYLERLGSEPEPLLQQEDQTPITPLPSGTDLSAFLNQRLQLTELGVEIQARMADKAGGLADRWLGGVFLQSGHPGWRWDQDAQRVRFVE
jgi:hypothetical protein